MNRQKTNVTDEQVIANADAGTYTIDENNYLVRLPASIICDGRGEVVWEKVAEFLAENFKFANIEGACHRYNPKTKTYEYVALKSLAYLIHHCFGDSALPTDTDLANIRRQLHTNVCGSSTQTKLVFDVLDDWFAEIDEDEDVIGQRVEDVYASYRVWAYDNRMMFVSESGFSKLLKNRGIETKRVSEDGCTVRRYVRR